MSIELIKSRVKKPTKVVVTSGMPYANGQIHLGHMAGAYVPADIFARWMRMLVGKDNVLYVCGTDDHGSTAEIAAMKAGKSIPEHIAGIHAHQYASMKRYAIGFDIFSGTSQDELRPFHAETTNEFLTKLNANGFLQKKTTRQWFDPSTNRFLQDRYVRGTCPNPKCNDTGAYSDECEVCGTHYDPSQLIDPRSALSDATPILKDTLHWWLDMWKSSETLLAWVKGKERTWRKAMFNEVYRTLVPSISFDNVHEEKYKAQKATLPKHKSSYGAGKQIVVTFENKADLAKGQESLLADGVTSRLVDGWAHRAITRDVSWGMPLPKEFGAEAKDKTFYVWPESLIAPISFSKLALHKRGLGKDEYKKYWCDPEAKVYQFLGQDNVYFYSVMQGTMWLGTQPDHSRAPVKGEYQLSDLLAVYHLQIGGEKMSKSRGNFYSADEMIDERGYTGEQLRYFLAMLSLPEKSSNFEIETFEEKNKFLAGPLNAALEKPIAACHSKFDSKVPVGELNDKVVQATNQMIERYIKSMEKAEYATLLFALENYARSINSMFTQFKPHDDRHPLDSRSNALFTCFYVLKNLMIMYYPFVPETMDRLRQSLNLPETVFTFDELGTVIPAGHVIGEKLEYFPGHSEPSE